MKTRIAQFAEAIEKGYADHPEAPPVVDFYAHYNNDDDECDGMCAIMAGAVALGFPTNRNKKHGGWHLWNYLKGILGLDRETEFLYNGFPTSLEDIIFDLNDKKKLPISELVSVLKELKKNG